MKLYRTGEAAFDEALERLTNRMELFSPEVLETVDAIVADVRAEGDEALVRYTEQFDGLRLSPKDIRVPPSAFKEARRRVGRAL